MNIRNSKPNGFTLLELLIVIGVIILFVVIGVILLGTARERERDAKRLSDIDTIRHSLDEYFYNNNRYPQAPTPVMLGSQGYRTICAGTATGFADSRADCGNATVYLEAIPQPPEPQPSQQVGYVYTSPNPNTSYTIDAALEGALNGVQGKVQITPAGMQLKQ